MELKVWNCPYFNILSCFLKSFFHHKSHLLMVNIFLVRIETFPTELWKCWKLSDSLHNKIEVFWDYNLAEIFLSLLLSWLTFNQEVESLAGVGGHAVPRRAGVPARVCRGDGLDGEDVVRHQEAARSLPSHLQQGSLRTLRRSLWTNPL